MHATIQEIDPRDWNELAGDNAFASHGWLLTCERCWLARVEALYFALRVDGTLVGGSVCYAAQVSPEVETLDDMLLGRLRPTTSRLGISFLPALICGPAQGYGWHIGVDARLDASGRDRVRRELLDAIEAEADRRGLPLSFVQVLDKEAALQALLQERRYLSSRNVPVAVMDIPWRTIDEYFAHLPGKRRRWYRRERRRNLAAGVRVEILDAGDERDERFMSLLEDEAREHGAAGIAFDRGLLRELRANMGDDALRFVARKADLISAGCLVLRHGDVAFAFAVGVDPKLGGRDFTYFQLNYYGLIEYAMAHGIKRIYYGRGTYSVKVRRGCFLVGASVYTRVKGPRRLLYALWYRIASWWNHHKLTPKMRRNVVLQTDRT